MRNAQPFNESLERVKANAKPIDDKTKDEVIFPLIRKAFITFLEISKKESSEI